jgi:DNA invertase Pin-like site-specific DNA recombinase
MFAHSTPLIPKDPNGPLRVLEIGRVSTTHQNIENIAASYADVERFLKTIYTDPMEIKQFGEQGSGMLTERESILEALEEIKTGMWDLVITEDISRPYRNPEYQIAFVHTCVDHDTRLIAVGDNLDTADENWQAALSMAVARHSMHGPDTIRRVKRTATYSFHRGGMTLKVKYGYRKLTKEEAASGQFSPKDLRITKVADCTPIIMEMRRRVMNGATYVAVAEWLTAEEISPWTYVTTKKWTGKLVRELLRDPILSGMRTFRDVVHKIVLKTGKHKRRPNPEGPETDFVAELAHMTREEQEALWDVMDARGEGFGPAKGRDNPLYNRARSKSLFPAQLARCGICGGLMYRSLNDQLRCQHSNKRLGETCWNHLQVHCCQARDKILPWLLLQLKRFPDIQKALLDAAWLEYQYENRKLTSTLKAIDKRITNLTCQARNITTAIEEGGKIKSLVIRLKELERQIKAAEKEHEATIVSQQVGVHYATRDEMAKHLDQAVLDLARTSFEFADLMRRVFIKFDIIPVQDLTTGQVHPRAKLVVRLANLARRGTAGQVGTTEPADLETTIDLFDSPVHIKHMPTCVQMKREHPELSLKKIAFKLKNDSKLQISYMTVKRAFDYFREMERQGLTDPYRVLETKPEYASRWKRRKTATVELPQMPDAGETDSGNLNPADPAA